MVDNYTVLHYVTAQGKDVFNQWLKDLRDIEAKVAIIKRLNRLQYGNPGDHKPCREGIWELRFGNGYRVYYALTGSKALVILCGGTKSSQRDDITRAVAYWKDWQKRS